MGIEANSDLRRGVPASAGAEDCPASCVSQEKQHESTIEGMLRGFQPRSGIGMSLQLALVNNFQTIVIWPWGAATCSNADGGTAPL